MSNHDLEIDGYLPEEPAQLTAPTTTLQPYFDPMLDVASVALSSSPLVTPSLLVPGQSHSFQNPGLTPGASLRSEGRTTQRSGLKARRSSEGEISVSSVS